MYKLYVKYEGATSIEEEHYFYSEEDAKNFVFVLRNGANSFYYRIDRIQVKNSQDVNNLISNLQKQKIICEFDISKICREIFNHKFEMIIATYKRKVKDHPLGIYTNQKNGQLSYTGYFSADTFDNITDKITKTCQSFFKTDCQVAVSLEED